MKQSEGSQSISHRRIYLKDRIPQIDDEIKKCRQTIRNIPVPKNIPVLGGGAKPDAAESSQLRQRIFAKERIAALQKERADCIAQLKAARDQKLKAK